jgi:hypothetical protein
MQSVVNAITPLKTYTFYDIFPTEVSAIDLSYDSDTIEEFTVDLPSSILGTWCLYLETGA